MIAAGSAADLARTSGVQSADYCIGNFLRIRVTPRTAGRLLTRDIALASTEAAGEPDLHLRVVPKLDLPSLQFVDIVGRTGYAGDQFVIYTKRPPLVAVSVPIDEIGIKPLVITCEEGTHSVPHIMAIVGLLLLARGVVPVHGSAFAYSGRGVLVSGWTKGGKTESLLAFAARGARFVADELALLTPGGAETQGLPVKIALWDWQLRQSPWLQRQLGFRTRTKFAVLRSLSKALRSAIPHVGHKTQWQLSRVEGLLQRQLNRYALPKEVFGENTQPDLRAPLDRVFLLRNAAKSTVDVSEADCEDVAERIAISSRMEWNGLMDHYGSFLFAFPERRNLFLEQAGEKQRELIHRALRGKRCYVVTHPYPFEFEALFRAMRPYVES